MAEVHTLALQLQSKQMEQALVRVDRGLMRVGAQATAAAARIKSLGGTAGMAARSFKNLATNAAAQNIQNLANASANAQRSVSSLGNATVTAAQSVRNLNTAAATPALRMTSSQLTNLVSRMQALSNSSTATGAALQRLGQGGGRALVPITNSAGALTRSLGVLNTATRGTAVSIGRLNSIPLSTFQRLRAEFSGSAQASTRASAAFTGFASSASRTGTAMTRLSSGVNRVSGEVTRIRGRMTDAASATSRFAQSARNAAGGMSILNTAVAGVSLFTLARGFTQLQNSFIQTDNAIRFLVKDTREADAVYASLQESAIRTGTAMELNGQIFRRLAIGTEELGLGSTELAGIVGILNDAMFASGTTAQEARAALIQLGQGMASATLRGDEFRSVAEQLPAVARAIADSLGLTIGQLRLFAHQGQLTPNIVVDALHRSAQAFRDQADDMQRSFTHASNNMFTSAQGLAREIERVIPVGAALRGTMDRISSGMIVAAAQIAKTRDRHKELESATDGATEATNANIEAVYKSTLVLTDQQKAILESVKATNVSTKEIRRAENIVEQTRTAQEKYNKEIEEFTALQEKGLLSQEQVNRASKAAREELRQASVTYDQLGQSQARVESSSNRLSSGFSKLTGSVGSHNRAIGSTRVAIDNLIPSQSRSSSQGSILAKSFNTGTGALNQFSGAAKGQIRTFAQLLQLYKTGVINTREYVSALNQLSAGLAASSSAADSAGAAQRKLQGEFKATAAAAREAASAGRGSSGGARSAANSTAGGFNSTNISGTVTGGFSLGPRIPDEYGGGFKFGLQYSQQGSARIRIRPQWYIYQNALRQQEKDREKQAMDEERKRIAESNRFQYGTNFVQGPPGADRVPAFLTRGEGVVTAQANRDNPGAVAALNRGESADGRKVTVVQNITTPDADSFRRSQRQMAQRARRDFDRAASRDT